VRVPACLPFIFLIFGLTTCQSTPPCPATQVADLPPTTPTAINQIDADSNSTELPVEIEIDKKKLQVDKVVTGPLCNDHWQGTIYVTCDVQVHEWVEQPLFLKDCDLTIEPGSVVYVASHNNAPYYNGCSCHTGEAE